MNYGNIPLTQINSGVKLGNTLAKTNLDFFLKNYRYFPEDVERNISDILLNGVSVRGFCYDI